MFQIEPATIIFNQDNRPVGFKLPQRRAGQVNPTSTGSERPNALLARFTGKDFIQAPHVADIFYMGYEDLLDMTPGPKGSTLISCTSAPLKMIWQASAWDELKNLFGKGEARLWVYPYRRGLYEYVKYSYSSYQRREEGVEQSLMRFIRNS